MWGNSRSSLGDSVAIVSCVSRHDAVSVSEMWSSSADDKLWTVQDSDTATRVKRSSSSSFWNLSIKTIIEDLDIPETFNVTENAADGYVYKVDVFSRTAQCCAILLILTTTVTVNLAIVGNIQRNEIKRRMVNFTLIAHLCTVDILGSVLIAPLPFVTTLQGKWVHNEFICTSSCVAIVAMWLQHLLVFSVLKIDQVLAGWLPVGRYPLITADAATFLVLTIWAIAFSISGLVIAFYGAIFEPAVMLCIPNLPPVFFIAIFALYCLIIGGMIISYCLFFCIIQRTKLMVSRNKGVKTSHWWGDVVLHLSPPVAFQQRCLLGLLSKGKGVEKVGWKSFARCLIMKE